MEKGRGKGKSKSTSKSSTPAPEGKGQSKGTAAPGGKPSVSTGGKPSGESVKKKPKQCVFYASPAGCIRGKNCPFLHQNDSVTKKPLPADPADVQRLKGKPQSAPKPANSGALSTAPGVAALLLEQHQSRLLLETTCWSNKREPSKASLINNRNNGAYEHPHGWSAL